MELAESGVDGATEGAVSGLATLRAGVLFRHSAREVGVELVDTGFDLVDLAANFGQTFACVLFDFLKCILHLVERMVFFDIRHGGSHLRVERG